MIGTRLMMDKKADHFSADKVLVLDLNASNTIATSASANGFKILDARLARRFLFILIIST